METIFQNHYVKIQEHHINDHILHRVTLVPFVRAIVVDEEKKKILLFRDLNSTDNTGYYLPECKIYSNIETYMDSIEKKDVLQNEFDL